MALRIPWDKYETALLIDAYLRVKNKELSQQEAIKEVSYRLRRRAILSGVEIDDVFRNINGITMQMKIIGGLVDERPSGLHSATKMFTDMVTLYKGNPVAFGEILIQAKGECAMQVNVQEKFLAWLSSRVSSVQLSEFYTVCKDIESVCLSKRILTKPLFETTNTGVIQGVIDTIRSNQMFQFKDLRQLEKMCKVMDYYMIFLREVPLPQDREMEIEAVPNNAESSSVVVESHVSLQDSSFTVIKEQEVPSQNEPADDSLTEQLAEENKETNDNEVVISSVAEGKVAFENWLINGSGLAMRSAQSYSSAINVAGQYSVRWGFSEKELFFIMDAEQVYQISMKLLANSEFAQLNDRQHNRYRAALSKYLDYCKAISPEATDSKLIRNVSEQEDEIKNNRIVFIAWAQSQQMQTEEILVCLSNIEKCNEFAKESNYIKEEHILLIQDMSTLECVFWKMRKDHRFVKLNNESQKHPVSAMNKLIAFRRATEKVETRTSVVHIPVEPTEKTVQRSILPISTPAIYSQVKERYSEILTENFVDGFRPAKAIDRNRFRMYYNDMFGEELIEDDECLIRILMEVGTLRDERIFVKDEIEQKDLLEAINETIMKTFEDGASCIYLDCLFARFQGPLAEMLHIYNVDSLENVLFSSGNRKYFKRYNYLFGYNKEPAPNRDVIEYMKESHLPVTYSEIENDLWYIPLDKIKTALVTTPSIVNVASEAYLYAPNLPVSESELQQITELIGQSLLQRSYISDVELMQIIEEHCPSVIMNTLDYPMWGLRNALAYLLQEKFSFRGAIISDKDEEISMAEVFADFCQHSEYITVDELKQFASELNTIIYWDSVYGEMVRINQNEFIHRNQIHFDIEQTDALLDSLISTDYTPIKSISLFLHFPAIEVPWNKFVLESYVANYSKKFRLIHASYTATDCCGAVVRQESGITDYRLLVIDVLAKNIGWRSKKDALQLLVNLGYQQRRSYSDIEKVMQEAKAKMQAYKK